MKDYYDNDPIPVSALLQELEYSKCCFHGDSASNELSSSIKVKEYSSNPGPYKPWFHSRFARSRISLPRNVCAADLRRITESLPSFVPSVEGLFKSKLRNKPEKVKSVKSARSVCSGADSEQEDDMNSENSNSESKNDTWVECDDCGKWRRVPQVSAMMSCSNYPLLMTFWI